MMFVYIIRSKVSGRIYVGHTRDIDMRLDYHNSGYVKATKFDRPWDLIAIEECEDRKAARWIEHQLKQSRGRRVKWIKNNSVV
ncbi:MAG: GIY-YIG nuclease family protein [Deltaproteobacteria bacterium]|nr:GIY-YIG nuclease family protein [Deltaproteobacteria bacterium]